MSNYSNLVQEAKSAMEAEESFWFQLELWEREFPGLRSVKEWDEKKVVGLRPRHLQVRYGGDLRPHNSKNRSQWLRSGKATRREFARRGW